MAPENARIFIVEDAPGVSYLAKKVLEESGHEVPLQAESLPEALAFVPRLKTERINVAVVDGNLEPGSLEGADGRMVAGKIRAEGLGISIICFSIDNHQFGDTFVDKSSWLKQLNLLTDAVRAL